MLWCGVVTKYQTTSSTTLPIAYLESLNDDNDDAIISASSTSSGCTEYESRETCKKSGLIAIRQHFLQKRYFIADHVADCILSNEACVRIVPYNTSAETEHVASQPTLFVRLPLHYSY